MRRLRELSKFLHPCVGDCPQPILIRNPIVKPTRFRYTALSGLASVSPGGTAVSGSDPGGADEPRDRSNRYKPHLRRHGRSGRGLFCSGLLDLPGFRARTTILFHKNGSRPAP